MNKLILIRAEPTISKCVNLTGHDYIFKLGKYKTKIWIANYILYTESEYKILEMILDGIVGELQWRNEHESK